MSEIDLELMACFCDEATDLLMKWESICLEIRKNRNAESFNGLFRIAHNLKGSSRSVGAMAFGEVVHHVEDVITAARDVKIQITDQLIEFLLAVQKNLDDWIFKLRSDANAVVNLGHICTKAQELLAETSGAPATVEAAPPVQVASVVEEKVNTVQSEKTVETPKAAKQNSKTQAPANSEESIRVKASKLDLLIQTIGELSLHQNIIKHSRRSKERSDQQMVENSLSMVQKITKEAYEQALSLKMQPIQPVLQRLERTCLDLGRDLGKKFEVVVTGGEVELERTVLEKIVDPLTHIVRNAVDHGLENSEQRKAAGKSENGQIKLSVAQNLDGITIMVEDDGKGLNKEIILKKAVEKKLIEPTASLSDDEIFNLIFLPGFSTAEKITNVSGRGVGMDVVKRALEELQGHIEISSELGRGSKFDIRLPASISIVDALVVSLSGFNYAIPISTLEEVIDIDDFNLNPSNSMLTLRGQVIPYKPLNEYLPHSGSSKGQFKHQTAVVSRVGKDRIAFAVERVLGQQQIVVRSLKGGLSTIYGFSGGTILGTGEPGLIIDLPFLTREFLKKFKRELAA